MLSASFSLVGGTLVIDGLGDGGNDSLSVGEADGAYRFTASDSNWMGDASAAGVGVEGSVLSVDKSLLDAAPGGLSIVGRGDSPLAVTFGDVDFSAMSGQVQVAGATSLSQTAGAVIVAPSVQAISLATPVAGTTISGLSVVGNLQVVAFGPITDAPGAEIKVTGDATFVSLRALPDADFNSDGIVDTDDFDVWLDGFGTIDATRSDGDANGDGRVDAADYNLWRDSIGQIAVEGGITLADTPDDVLSVGGQARFEARGDLDPAASALRYDIAVGGEAGGAVVLGSLSFAGQDVSVYETSTDGLRLDGQNLSRSLWLVSDASITDGPGARVEHTGRATLQADGPIVLADTPNDVFAFTGGFRDGPTGVYSSFTAAEIQVGLGGTFSTATLDFNAEGAVEIVELPRPGSPAGAVAVMTLAGSSSAGELTLTSGSIETAPGARIAVGGPALFTAENRIALSRSAGESLIVSSDDDSAVATFRASSVSVGLGGLFAADGLSITADSVAIREGVGPTDPRPGTRLVGANSSSSLNLTTAGPLTDTATTRTTVSGPALFTAGGAIDLARGAAPTNSLIVGGGASFISVGGEQAIRVGVGTAGDNAGATTRFGAVTFSAPAGAIAIAEDDGTLLAGHSTASTLVLTSASAITDQPSATVTVSGDATFTSLTDASIALADQVGNRLSVGGVASFAGGAVSVGAAGQFATGALSFQASGSAAFNEASPGADAAPGTVLVGANSAASLLLTSAGPITDAPSASLDVNGDAQLTAVGSITLADDNLQPTSNVIVVDGLASFTATGPSPSIDLGVTPLGLPARATARFGSLRFDAAGGMVRIAEDSGAQIGETADAAVGTLLSGQSTAGDLELTTEGDLTDAPGAVTRIANSATLAAIDSDIVLGDAGAILDLGDPAAFDPTQFLALAAMNVSIVAATAVNLRSSAEDAPIVGTLYLRAKGTVSQVGGVDGDFAPLAAGRIAVDSEGGAVLLSRVELTDDSGPNLALHAAVGFDLNGLPTEGPGAFPVRLIPGDAATAFSPIGVVESATRDSRDDGSGLTSLPGAVIERSAPVGDAYGIVAVVRGDAAVGVVPDATATQANLVGIEVASAANAFLQTLADGQEPGDLLFTAGGDGQPIAPGGVVVQMRGGVFTALATGRLSIDTVGPDEQAMTTLPTTRLVSATGVVTSVAEFATVNGLTGRPRTDAGPRFVLDPADDGAQAATTDLVLASNDFEQRITAEIGSRDETNLIVVLDWADVVDPFQPRVPATRLPVAPNTPGSSPSPEVAVALASLDASTRVDGLVQQSEPPLDFRVVTIRYYYADAFIPVNPSQDSLPTAVTVFNDPSINLYDNVRADAESGVASFRNLNVTVNAVEPDIRSVEGFTLPIPRETPTPRRVVESVTLPATTPLAVEQGADFARRSSVVATAEVILYGKVDPNDPDEWATDVPGEQWPQQWEGVTDAEADGLTEQDFIRQIRERIDNGPASEGRYRIVVETPRGVQPLEEWVKGDLEPSDDFRQDVEASFDAAPVDETPAEPLPAINDQGAVSPDYNGPPPGAAVAVAGVAVPAAVTTRQSARLSQRWRRFADAVRGGEGPR